MIKVSEPPFLETSRVVNCSLSVQTIKDLKERNQFFLVDADGLYITTRDPELIKGYRNVVMTPNKNEYKRLGDQLGIDVEDPDSQKRIVEALGGPTIVRKGARDIIMDPDGGVIEGTDVGCPRRAGGQVYHQFPDPSCVSSCSILESS